MPPRDLLLTIAVHAERLHEDAVWAATERLARFAQRRGVKLTFFVHPYWSRIDGCDVSDRVHELSCLGHEIGQHTHYYDPAEQLRTGKKITRLDPAHVMRRLDEDLRDLQRMGSTPVGFVAGAWAVTPELEAWLEENGFSYDCSFRAGPAGDQVKGPGSVAHAQPFLSMKGVTEIPTTVAVSRSLSLRRPISVSSLAYHLAYVHDTDLVSRRIRLTANLLIRVASRRGWKFLAAGDLADRLRFELERSQT